MAKETLNQKRAKLTDLVVKARLEWNHQKHIVEKEVKKNHPGLQWYEEMDLVEDDPRVQVANARLMALCEAANIIGAELF